MTLDVPGASGRRQQAFWGVEEWTAQWFIVGSLVQLYIWVPSLV